MEDRLRTAIGWGFESPRLHHIEVNRRLGGAVAPKILSHRKMDGPIGLLTINRLTPAGISGGGSTREPVLFERSSNVGEGKFGTASVEVQLVTRPTGEVRGPNRQPYLIASGGAASAAEHALA